MALRRSRVRIPLGPPKLSTRHECFFFNPTAQQPPEGGSLPDGRSGARLNGIEEVVPKTKHSS